jgi:hypothetical protein
MIASNENKTNPFCFRIANQTLAVLHAQGLHNTSMCANKGPQMKVRCIDLAVFALSSAVHAQDATRLLRFSGTESSQSQQKIATVIRAIADVAQISADPANPSLSITPGSERCAGPVALHGTSPASSHSLKALQSNNSKKSPSRSEHPEPDAR